MNQEDPREELIARYTSSCLMKAGEMLFTPGEACRFLQELSVLGVGVVGMDLWTKTPHGLMEIPGGVDLCPTAGEPAGPLENLARARIFLERHVPPEIAYVSFVLED